MPEPTRENLINFYQQLDEEHHHNNNNLLPLEGALPPDLQYGSRNGFRIIMTMILSVRNNDKRLFKALKILFQRYPSFNDFKTLLNDQNRMRTTLHSFGVNNNFVRAWNFTSRFRDWDGIRNLSHEEIDSLNRVDQFGPNKILNCLQAYYLGENNAFPLDSPALKALHEFNFYKGINNRDRIRDDIKAKLIGISGVNLINFHELLRFKGQTNGKSANKKNDVIIGWNAWRILCSNRWPNFSKEWIRANLVRDNELAGELWTFIEVLLNKFKNNNLIQPSLNGGNKHAPSDPYPDRALSKRTSEHSKTSKDTFNKVHRIKRWADHPEQINHKIIRAYLHLENSGDVSLEDLRNICSDRSKHSNYYVENFKAHYSSMKIDNGNSHGKVFYDENGLVFILNQPRKEINKYFS